MNDTPYDLRLRLENFTNNSGETIPAYGCIKITGSTNGVFSATKPDGLCERTIIAFNGEKPVPNGESGLCSQDFPTFAMYDPADGTPANGELWGPLDTFELRKYQPGFRIVGDVINTANTVAKIVPDMPRKFKAQLTARTAVSCGQSGSGSTVTSTAHTVYRYSFIGIKRIIDGNGCPANADTELGPDISGVAEEWNNRKVAVGTIVEIEAVYREDLSASGSSDGIASGSGCVFMFEADQIEIAADARYRYFCIDGINKEFIESDSGLTYLRDNGCCQCTPSGSGSGSNCCPAGPQNLCISFQRLSGQDCMNPEAMGIAPGCCCSLDGKSVTVSSIGADNPGVFSGGEAVDNFTLHAQIVTNACRNQWFLSVFRSPFFNAKCGLQAVVNTANCATGFTVDVTDAAFGCTSPSSRPTYRITVVSGVCPQGSGSGSGGALGGCGCLWQGSPLGISWTLIGSDTSVCSPCSTPPDPAAPNEIRYANCDGSTCTPSGGGGGGPGCGDCGGANRTATPSAATGFLTALTTQALTFSGGLWLSPAFTLCGRTAFIVFWCENGTWLCGIKGAGQGFVAQPGGTCASMTFKLNYGTDNTICPGQGGTATITVTT